MAMIVTDAFWRELFICVASSFAAILSFLNNRQSRRNRIMLREVHEKVNGQTEERVARAYEDGQKRVPQILVVDDDVNDLLLARYALEPFGCEVTEASSVDVVDKLITARIGAARGLPFDFILLDMRMHGHEPTEFLELLERKVPRIPVVIITGYPELIRETDAFRVPRIWIVKPLTTDHVRRLLEQFSVPYYKRPQENVEI